MQKQVWHEIQISWLPELLLLYYLWHLFPFSEHNTFLVMVVNYQKSPEIQIKSPKDSFGLVFTDPQEFPLQHLIKKEEHPSY